jgi:hypothetical protein
MASARAIFSFKIRKCLNLLTTWVGFLVVQKQSGALGLRWKTKALEIHA